MPDENKVWTVLSMLEWATEYFKENRVPNPRLSIEWLLADVLELKRLDLYLKYDRPLSDSELNRLRPLVKRRLKHEPLQYITGYTDFLNCKIEVNPNVLIPRPETEHLTELILHENSHLAGKSINFLDIGTGSGCIPIATAKKMPDWRCFAIDNSEKALETARKNATLNQVEVEFISANLFNLNIEVIFDYQMQFDLIVSNPPYILPEEIDHVEEQVSEFEPPEALFHPEPRKAYQSIGDFASEKLVRKGRLYLECNAAFTDRIQNDLKELFNQVDILPDYDKKKRFIRASNPL